VGAVTGFAFTPAVRWQRKARIALAGPAGSGKTFTALRLASAMGARVAVVDTEHDSASLYARGADGQGFDFDTLSLASFAPANLVGALASAAQGRYDVAVVDGLSPFWSGPGGMLEQADIGATKNGGNSFAGWKEARPQERQLLEALLSFPGHLIVTMRSKTDYVVETDDRGRKVPRKIGLKPEQRDGIEYEFDVVGELDSDNTLVVSKTRFPALSGLVVSQPGEELAEQVLAWLSGGIEVPDPMLLVDRASAPDLTWADARLLYHELKERQLLGIAMLRPGSGEPCSLGQYLDSRGKAMKQAALDDLKKTAADAGISDQELQQEFRAMHHWPIAQAPVDKVIEFTQMLRGGPPQ
jgi:hypothetical protein